MTWSRFDDLYDEHDKVQRAWDADHATIGIHVMATTACNRWLSDGVVRPRWLLGVLPDKRERERVLQALVEVELFDVLTAGDTVIVLDSGENEIVLGPYPEDRYVVHDFLERHDSSVQVKERRRKDAERKARVRHSSAGSPPGVRSDITPDSAGSPGPPRGRARASRPDPTLPSPTETPPQPPADRGGSRPKKSTPKGKGTRSRANGTNPRAVEEQQRVASLAQQLQPPDDTSEKAWASIRDRLRGMVDDSTWGLWVEPLKLVAVRQAGDGSVAELVIDADEEKREWVNRRFGKTLAAASAGHGPPTRVATKDEAFGLALRSGAAA